MKIAEMIDKLTLLMNKVGEDRELVFVSCDGENDIFTPEYPIAGEFRDCDGNEYDCAFLMSMSGDEFTRKDVPHYNWKPYEDKVDD